SSAKPMMAFSGARSFWFSSARKARSVVERVSETSGPGEDSFIAFISPSWNSRLRSRRGPNFRRLGFCLESQTGWLVEAQVPQLFHHLEIAPHFVFVRAENERGFVRDQVCFVSLQERLVEAVPAHGVARLDDFLESPVLAFAVEQSLARAQAAAHDLGNEEPSAALGLGHQSLAHDVANRDGQALPQLLFFFLAEHAENAVDRLAGIDGMHRGENDVA